MQQKIEKAQKAFIDWKNTSFTERQQILKPIANLLEEHIDTYARTISTEMGKPIAQARAEIKKSALMVNYYTDLHDVFTPEKVETEYQISEIHYQPKGIILGVMPWNFPFWQVLRFAIPAILAGNTVLLKHASICFESGNLIEQLFLEAGCPEGIFQNLEIGHQEVDEVLSNPMVRGVSLTGSEKAGSSVAANAGKHIKKSLLELGGSDAFIVLDDANLDEAAKIGAKARLQNCGQTCIAAKRFIVQDTIYDDFIEKLKEEFRTYVPGDCMLPETKIAGMARPDLADELWGQYQRAIEGGANIIKALERVDAQTFIPGIIEIMTENPIHQEEVFGPLALVLRCSSDQDAVDIANGVPFGLGNAVWTQSKQRVQSFIENLQSGTVSINKQTSSDPRLPFGGIKNSGYGLELSTHALFEFVNTKTIVGGL